MMKRLVLILIALLAAQPAAAQEYFKKVPDLSVYGGLQDWSLWKSRAANPGSDLLKGALFGGRADWDFTRRWGFEAAYGYGRDNLRLFPRGQGEDFTAHSHQGALNPVFHFTSPTSKIRPFVTAGLSGVWFDPSSDAKARARQAPLSNLGAGQLDLKFEPGFNWGGGVKVNLTKLLQVRVDARNVLTPNPHFMIPDGPLVPGGVFIAPKGIASALQLTGGVGVRLGNSDGVVKPDGKRIKLALNADPSVIPYGTTRNVQAITDLPGEAKPKFQWTVNGQNMDAAGPNLALRGDRTGANRVCANVSASGYNSASECIDLTVGGAETGPKPINVTLAANPPTVNPGKSSSVSAATDLPAGTPMNYSWTVNGAKVAETGPAYTFSTEGKQPGVYKVCVTVTARGYTDRTECTDVTIASCGNPALTAGAGGVTEIMAGERVNLPFSAQPGPCGAPVQLSYRASEGSVSASATGATFDSSSMAFDMGRRSQLQRKTVTITATATDSAGGSSTAQSQVVVKLAPVAQRLDDILYSAHNTRVNNCAKRLLLEVLVPKLKADPTAKVVLVGHTDESDRGGTTTVVRRGKGKNARRVTRTVPTVTALDRARVMNAAAVISAGDTGTCAAIELNRIKVSYAGPSQIAEPRPALCATSTQTRASAAKPDGRARYRRVEVWLVPEGAPMPATGAVVRDAPSVEIKALGCPR